MAIHYHMIVFDAVEEDFDFNTFYTQEEREAAYQQALRIYDGPNIFIANRNSGHPDPVYVWTISWRAKDESHTEVQVYATEEAALADLKRMLAEDGWWEDYCRASCGAMPTDPRQALEIVQQEAWEHGESMIDFDRVPLHT